MLKRRALLYGMDFFEWYTLQEIAWKYWWVSVDMTNTSVSSWFPSLNISTSKRPIRFLEFLKVNWEHYVGDKKTRLEGEDWFSGA